MSSVVNLNTKYDLGLTVPRRRNITIDNERGAAARDVFTLDVQGQSLHDLQQMMKEIVIEETKEQIELDNQPRALAVDNNSFKHLAELERKAEVLFGSVITRAAMKLVENEIRIFMSVLNRFGQYAAPTGDGFKAFDADFSNSQWRWYAIDEGEAWKPLSGPQDIASKGVVFAPISDAEGFKLAYAMYWARRGGWKPFEKQKGISRSQLGPMGQLSRRLKSKSLLRAYSIDARWYTPNNAADVGAPMVKIWNRTRTRGRR